MKRYAVTIRERDSIARKRGDAIGATFWGGTLEASSPQIARRDALQMFLKPLDVAALPEDQRAHGAALEALARLKREAYLRGECFVTCRLSKAKG